MTGTSYERELAAAVLGLVIKRCKNPNAVYVPVESIANALIDVLATVIALAPQSASQDFQRRVMDHLADRLQRRATEAIASRDVRAFVRSCFLDADSIGGHA